MLALGSFFGEVSSKGRIPVADVFSGIVKGVSQIPGASFLHVGVAVFELPGLVGRGGHPRIGQQFVRGVKAREITDFSQDHGAHTAANAWNAGNGRMQIAHDGLNSSLNFFDLSIQFPDETDGVLQFQGLSRHSGANGTSGGVPELHSHIPSIVAMGCVSQQGLQPRQVCVGDLLGSRKFRQQRINRG